ncbi:MAG: AMP-binding protein [Polyangiaceae bacterium]|nr:AMP-binding protein [Polyangiaceae bacterium]
MSLPETLWARWVRHAEALPDARAVVHWRAGEEPTTWTRRALLDDATRLAHVLREHGVGRGDVCALMLRHEPRFYPLYMAIAALGAIPSVLAYPNPRLHPDKFVHGLSGMAQRSGLRWLLTERGLESLVTRVTNAENSTIQGILFPHEWPRGAATAMACDASPDDVCLLQHSSGTTGLQKAVALSHRAVLQHVDGYATAIGLSASDIVASWLPLYHDMGLIAAFHLPLAAGITCVQIDPFEWVAMPALLLQVIARERATLAWLPNFAYNFMAERVRAEELDGVDLGSVRMLVNCSEPVRADSHAKFLERFAPLGLRADTLAACYAMAETTFAASQTRPGSAARVLSVDREALRAGRATDTRDASAARRCVSSGIPIGGCVLKAVDGDGREVADDAVGEIWIQSESMFDGYRNDPEKTAEALRDGWYRSGDYGFRRGGEWFVVGRKKDVIIVAGRNLYPEDIEDAVGVVPGVLAGRVVAFGIDDEVLGTESVCVIAESTVRDEAGQRELRLAILRAGMAIDVTVGRVYIAPPRWLIKSSAGKPSRSTNRDRVLGGELAAQ